MAKLYILENDTADVVNATKLQNQIPQSVVAGVTEALEATFPLFFRILLGEQYPCAACSGPRQSYRLSALGSKRIARLGTEIEG